MQLTFLISSLLAATALAAPAAVMPRNTTITTPSTGATQTLYPSLQVRWRSQDPNTRAKHTNRGHLLSKPNEQVHTAVYFALSDPSLKGKTCKLVFRLTNDDWIVPGTAGLPAMFDIYRLNGCLNEGYSWGNRIPRGLIIGELVPKKGSAAEWLGAGDWEQDKMEPKMGSAPVWPCELGEYSFEMVAHPGDNIGWESGRKNGLMIEVSN